MYIHHNTIVHKRVLASTDEISTLTFLELDHEYNLTYLVDMSILPSSILLPKSSDSKHTEWEHSSGAQGTRNK